MRSKFNVIIKRLCPVLVEDLADLIAQRERLADLLSIDIGPVALRLVEELREDAYGRQNILDSYLISPRIVLRAPRGIRHERDGLPEVLPQLLRLRHVGRHLAEDIIVIPAVYEPDVLALLPEGPDYELDSDDLTEIADVDSAGRRDSRCACIYFLIAFLADDLIRHDIGPMGTLVLDFTHVPDYGKEGYLIQGTAFAGLISGSGAIITA